MLDVYVVINAECAFGAAARAAIFAGVQPSRLTLRGLPLSGGVAPGYSQYSLPGWIVLLAVNLCIVRKISRPRILKVIGKYQKGRHVDDPTMADCVVYTRCRSLTIDFEQPTTLNADGEVST